MYALGFIGVGAAGLGDYGRAEAALEEALRLARERRHPRAIADMARHLGTMHLALGQRGRAAALFGESLTLYLGQGDHWHASEAVELIGAVACQECAWVQAARLLGAAEAMRDALGVVLNPRLADHQRDVATVRAHLSAEDFAANWASGRDLSLEQGTAEALAFARTVGEQPARVQAASSPAHPVSARECEVAALVAQGLTNRQIAARLVISERTAEGHIRNILGKLDLTSRSQVAAWAVAHGLAEAPGT